MQKVAERNGWTKFVSMQGVYNLLYREEERQVMIPSCNGVVANFAKGDEPFLL